jgi:DNA-directed RNA polymerase specialized sigma24 family protein
MPVAGADQFETAAIPHLDALFQTAVQLTASRKEAEDVLKEVYDIAFESFEAGVWRDSQEMFKVLMRLLRTRPRTLPDSSAIGGTLVSALSRMPLNLRQIVLLVDGQALSYSQTAEILELSTDAVADRVVAAREHLLEHSITRE